jgi:hypothetical protein
VLKEMLARMQWHLFWQRFERNAFLQWHLSGVGLKGMPASKEVSSIPGVSGYPIQS